jgi:hypothetical protein
MIGRFRQKMPSADESEMIETLRKWGTAPVPVEPQPPLSPTLQVESLRAVIARERHARADRETRKKVLRWALAAAALGGLIWSTEEISALLLQNPNAARVSRGLVSEGLISEGDEPRDPSSQKPQTDAKTLSSRTVSPTVEVRGNVLHLSQASGLSPASDAAEVDPAGAAEASRTSASGRVSLGSTVEAGPEGAEVIAEATEAQLASGAQLVLKDISPAEERWFVRTGSVRFEVEPLRKKKVIVETADSRFEVVGTAFTVVSSRTANGGELTTLRVHHGRVRVATHGTGELLIGPHGRWSSQAGLSRAGSSRAASSRAASSRAASRKSREMSGVSKPGGNTGVVSAPSTTLAEENRIFEAALRARNAGEHRESARLFADLITRYPNSSLRREAEHEIARARARLE